MKSSAFHKGGVLLFAVFALLFSIQINLLAQVPMVKSQAPGYYRMMVGSFEITALYDGVIVGNSSLMHNAAIEEINALVNHVYMAPDKVKMAVNAYLVNTGKNLVLVDVGTAKVFGPGLGSVLQNLIASGYKPEQVDAIMVTHMHGDHIGGLLTDDGKPVFPNAVVYSTKEEKDFWYSEVIESKAHEQLKPAFKMVQNLLKPYIAAGKFKLITAGEEPVAGIKAVDIKGHTAGHLAFDVKSGSESILMIGDLVHVSEVQLKRPDVTLVFDSDEKKAASVRIEMFKSIAQKGTLIAGVHLPFPGIGRLASEGDKGYSWVPVGF